MDQLCSLYGELIRDSKVFQSFNERVYELARANDLASEDFKLGLSRISSETSRYYLQKVGIDNL